MNRKERRAAGKQGNAAALFACAARLREEGHPEKAIALYREALALKPAFHEAHNNLGRILHEQGLLDEARRHLLAALKLQPNDPVILNNLGNVTLDRGQPAQAIEMFKEAVALRPAYPEPHAGLGMALAALGRVDDALAPLRQALDHDPQNLRARISLGLALADLGQTIEALDQAEIVSRSGDRPFFPHRSLGVLLARCGATDAARFCFNAHLKNDPQDREGVGLLMAGLGDTPIPERASDAHLDTIYANRATDWDQRAMEATGYRGAGLVSSMLSRLAPQTGLDILDAGCGTGLVGALVAAKAKHLVGIDASIPMLERAREKGVYHDLRSGDLVGFLNSHPDTFDAVTCAATLIHFGDLRVAFLAAAAALRDHGLFVFTLFPNTADENAVAVGSFDGLAQGGCFVHGRSYVARMAEATGFAVDALELDIHEYHQGKPKMGLVAALRRVRRRQPQATAA